MIDAVPGQSKQFDTTVHRGGVGYVTSGATVTFALYDEDETAVVTSTTGSHTVTGIWTGTLTIPSTVGTYTLLVTVAYAGEETVYQRETVRVGPALNRGGATRAELRYDVARNMGEVVRLTCTGGGSALTFEDLENLHEPNDFFLGREFVVTHGASANVGVRRKVTDSEESTNRVTLHSAVPSAFVAGDRAELYNLREIGVSFEEINGAINDGLRQAARLGGHRLSAVLTADFDRDAPALSIPSQFRWLSGVEYQNDLDDWVRIDPAPHFRGGGWTVRADSRQVEILGNERERADGRAVRVHGLGVFDTLESDSDATHVDHAWLLAYCLWRLYHLKWQRDNSESAERWAGYWGDQAARLEPRAVTHKPPHAIRTGI